MTDDEKIESSLPESSMRAPEKKGGLSMKVFVIGLPLFIVQLLAVYFITANILLNKITDDLTHHNTETETGESVNEEDSSDHVELGKYLYSVEDVIVNPAGSRTKTLLMASVAFDLKSEENKVEIEGKEILVKDLVISVLSSKSVDQLGNTAYRDTLRYEIQDKLGEFLPTVGVNKIYFSKYIIQ